ncbi:MAG: sigma-54 dependent transcriptional regulator [Rickettsiales bacterium]|nr:sigma-54 dependent transcriptional regulator [Rickettsiales bacterium]
MARHILIADDDILQQRMIQKALEPHAGYTASIAQNGHEVLYYLKQKDDIDLVLLDLGMPEMGGFEALENLRENYPDLPVIIVTGSDDLRDAVNALKLGANDFITKPIHPERLITSINNMFETQTLEKEVKRLRKKAGEVGGFRDLIGHETGLKQVIGISERAAPSDIPILISGASGVGKELFAYAIHHASDRNKGAFIAINCGAIPEKLVESTLFGHEKGSFTGAVSKKSGKFLEAQNGTLFLDEIGELPLDAQVKILRAVQQQEIEPVGATNTVQVNVRIISATNRHLPREVKEGRFREDLYFRLNGIPIEIPSLSQRREDIPELTEHFIQHYAKQNNCEAPTLTDEAMEYLLQYEWPGNVRELETAIHRAVVLDTDGTISVRAFTHFLSNTSYLGHPELDITGEANGYIGLRNQQGQFKSLKAMEWEVMEEVLNAYQGNVVTASKALGIGKSTLYRRIDEEKGIDTPVEEPIEGTGA